MVESFKGMEGEPISSVKGSPQCYHRRSRWHQWHLKTIKKKKKKTIGVSFARPWN
jgi:hypothetical protein